MDCRSKRTNRAITFSAPGITALCLSLSLGLLSSTAVAETEIKSDESLKIYGQSELPKVLYIVPWKRRKAGEIDMPSSTSLASDVLEPIDPEIFRRQIRYHDIITKHQADNSSQP